MVQNKALVFAKVPQGWPVAGEHITAETSDFDLDAAPPSKGVVLKVGYSSIDPYMRGRMREAHIKSYAPAFELGKPISVYAVAKVIKTDTDKFKVGDVVYGYIPMQNYAAMNEQYTKSLEIVDNPWDLDYAYFLGALGMPGLTAYTGLYKIGKPKKGETIFISAASGAVGQLVGQLARHEGLKVIGSVGSDDKLEFITKDLQFDGGFNYKKEKPADALKRLAPNGVDIYFENVGGEQLEAAINVMNTFGRIIACGMISQYNNAPGEGYGVKNLVNFVAKRITMSGFIVGDPGYGDEYKKDAHDKVGAWIADGSVKVVQSITDGIDKTPEAVIGMFKGENFGKAVIKVGDLKEQ